MKLLKTKMAAVLLTVAVALGGVIAGIILIPTVQADNNVSASNTDDPLVSLSYVNEVLVPQIKADILSSVTNGDTASSGSFFSVVRLTYGQKLLSCGSVEIVLRSGKCSALCPGVNGIGDLTSGAELSNGQLLTANNLCLIPRNDGRGIICSTGEAYVMVRGQYTIE